jgi:hypothetical protein
VLLAMPNTSTRLTTKMPFLVTRKTMGSTSVWFVTIISGSSYCTAENVDKPKLRMVILPPTLGELFLVEFLY